MVMRGTWKKGRVAQGGKYGERREYHALQGIPPIWERETGITDSEWESGMASDMMMEGTRRGGYKSTVIRECV